MPAQPVLSQNRPVLHGGAGDDRMTKQSDQQIDLRRCPARIGRIGRLAVATQVIENPRNHCGFLDTGDHPQLPATAPTDLDVDREYAFEPLRPGEAPLPIAGRCFATLTGPVGSGAPGLGYDPGPIRTRRRKHTVIAGQVRAGLWHQRGEPGDEVLGLEYDVRRSIPTVRPA